VTCDDLQTPLSAGAARNAREVPPARHGKKSAGRLRLACRRQPSALAQAVRTAARPRMLYFRRDIRDRDPAARERREDIAKARDVFLRRSPANENRRPGSPRNARPFPRPTLAATSRELQNPSSTLCVLCAFARCSARSISRGNPTALNSPRQPLRLQERPPDAEQMERPNAARTPSSAPAAQVARGRGAGHPSANLTQAQALGIDGMTPTVRGELLRTRQALSLEGKVALRTCPRPSSAGS